MNRHRNIKPAIYNAARLVEKPIPITQQRQDDDGRSHVDTSMDNTSNNIDSIEKDVSTSQNDNASASDHSSHEPDNTNKETDQIEQKLSTH